MLREGGNAFDAAIASGLAAIVVEPVLSSFGGGGFLLGRTAAGEATLFDFFVDTPGRGLAPGEREPCLEPLTVRFPGCDQVFNAGLGSVAVPGTLRGFLHVHRKLGRLPLAEVIAPAVELAREGGPLNGPQAYILELVGPIMVLTEEGRRLYSRDGQLLQEGDRLPNPELATFFESLLDDGEREFHEGAIARRLVEDMENGHGLVTLEDLAGYRVIERRPLEHDYRGHRVLTNPSPSLGGSLLALSLDLMTEKDLSSSSWGEERHLHWLMRVMKEVDRLRDRGIIGPGDLPAATRAEALQRLRCSSQGTTHVSTWDADGNATSMTTSNGAGSGTFVPGTGIMLNNMMGEDDLHPDGFHASPPGQRVPSMMTPSLVLRDDRLRLVLGSGGSKRIRTAVLQALSSVVDFDLGTREAIDAPRMHWDGASLQVEPGFDAAVLDALEREGSVTRWSNRDVYFGGVQAVAPDGTGAGDPRRGGCCVVA